MVKNLALASTDGCERPDQPPQAAPRARGAGGHQALRLLDLSTVGCRIATQAAIRTGTRLLIKIPGLEFWQGTVVWRRGHDAGVEFERELHPAIVERYAEVFAPG